MHKLWLGLAMGVFLFGADYGEAFAQEQEPEVIPNCALNEIECFLVGRWLMSNPPAPISPENSTSTTESYELTFFANGMYFGTSTLVNEATEGRRTVINLQFIGKWNALENAMSGQQNLTFYDVRTIARIDPETPVTGGDLTDFEKGFPAGQTAPLDRINSNLIVIGSGGLEWRRIN